MAKKTSGTDSFSAAAMADLAILRNQETASHRGKGVCPLTASHRGTDIFSATVVADFVPSRQARNRAHSPSSLPVNSRCASRYFERVLATTSSGNGGGGLFLSQPLLASQSR